MSEEKKNEVTEVVKEEARQLTEEELENVNGGVEIIEIGSGMTHSAAAAEE